MEIDIKPKMSSQAPEQSPLDQAKAETNELYQKVQRDLDSLRTAPLNEFGNRIDSLIESVKLSRDSAGHSIQTALETSDSRIHDLKDNLQAKQTQLEHVQGTLRSERVQAANFRTESSAREQDANDKYQATKSALDTAEEEVFRIGCECAIFREDLNTEKQQNVDLRADLETAKERALAAENEKNAFQSRLVQINDDMTALVSSSTRQTNVAQPSASPALSLSDELKYESTYLDEPLLHDHHIRAESPNLHPGHAMSNPEFDMLLCQKVLDEVKDKKNWHYNRYLDSAAPNVHSPFGAITRPMNLDTMTEKLDKGAYDSVDSFKTDFYLMVTNCKRLNPPHSLAHIAAVELARIFEQTWSAQLTSSHQCPESASSTQDASNKKRKADTESLVPSEDGHVQKRRSGAPLEQDISRVQHVNPDNCEGLPVSSSSDQPKDIFIETGKDDTYNMKGLLTTGTRLDIKANLEVTPKFVSVIKSPNTLPSGWELLIPDEYRLTAHAVPATVEQGLDKAAADLSKDMVIMRLVPISDADKSEFDRILKYLLDKERYVTVSHADSDNVQSIHLIPASKLASYPRFWSILDPNLLPPAKTEDVLFMAIVFRLREDIHREVRQAWDGFIKAVHDLNIEEIAAMHDHLLHHQLPVFGPRMNTLSRAAGSRFILSQIPRSQEVLDPRLQGIAPNVLRISDPKPDRPSKLRVDGMERPERIFVLGRLFIGSRRYGLLVIDIQHRDRPLWLIHGIQKAHPGFIRCLTLLRSKFPTSLVEWESTLTAELYKTQVKKCLKDKGLKLEQYKLPE